MARKICVVTGSRAEYGLLFGLLKEIQEDPDLCLQLVVTGMHLSPEFGLTYKTILQDGFEIHERVEILLSSDSTQGVSKSVGLGLIGFADAFERLKPDLLVLLGDRFEVFAAAQAAMFARIPIAHLHGGETTEGNFDEAIRHSITKMAHLHFTSAEVYRNRVIQLGEAPNRVWNVGALAVDNLKQVPLWSRNQLIENLNITWGNPMLLVTYHPVTNSEESPESQLKALFEAIDAFPNAKAVITKANADTAGRIINQLIETYAATQPHRIFAFTSLGQVRYLSMLQECDLVLGNSSSGIIEAPLFGKPTINIGLRQAGRLRTSSILDCEASKEAIIDAIKTGLSSRFKAQAKETPSPYGQVGVAKRIKAVVKSMPLEGILFKTFYDLSQ